VTVPPPALGPEKVAGRLCTRPVGDGRVARAGVSSVCSPFVPRDHSSEGSSGLLPGLITDSSISQSRGSGRGVSAHASRNLRLGGVEEQKPANYNVSYPPPIDREWGRFTAAIPNLTHPKLPTCYPAPVVGAAVAPDSPPPPFVGSRVGPAGREGRPGVCTEGSPPSGHDHRPHPSCRESPESAAAMASFSRAAIHQTVRVTATLGRERHSTEHRPGISPGTRSIRPETGGCSFELPLSFGLQLLPRGSGRNVSHSSRPDLESWRHASRWICRRVGPAWQRP